MKKYICECGGRLRRTYIRVENGKWQRTDYWMCMLCERLILDEELGMLIPDLDKYKKLSMFLVEDSLTSLQESISLKIKNIERKILFSNIDSPDILEKIKSMPITDRPKLTEPEAIFRNICKKYNLPYRYVGDKKYRIGRFYPDFIESNGEKVCIEIMGDYWHSPLLNFKLKVPERATLTYKRKYYKQHKWQPVFIWESDLHRNDSEQFVLNLLKRELR